MYIIKTAVVVCNFVYTYRAWMDSRKSLKLHDKPVLFKLIHFMSSGTTKLFCCYKVKRRPL